MHDGHPTRRELLELIALAGAGCAISEPDQVLVPYARQPPELVPGRSLAYATTSTLDGYVTGVLAQAQGGRPIKIEGNPAHPASLGGTSAYEQAAIMGLYGPSRLREARYR